jgi:FkbM family methyltransferase
MSGLYVEPIPYIFELLKKNMGEKNLYENSAICDYDGEVEMVTVKKEMLDEGHILSWFRGMSSIFPPKNGLGADVNKIILDNDTDRIMVPCITFDTLLKKHEISNFDVVSIDTEGHDYQILKQIDLEKYRPKLIRIEWGIISNEEKDLVISKYTEANYIFEVNGEDLDATPKEIYDLINV